MKHIRKKFLFHDRLKQMTEMPSAFTEVDLNSINQKFLKDKSKNNFVILQTDHADKVFSFIYNDNGKQCVIPVPDFSLVNFNFAYQLNMQRKELKKKLVQNLSDLSLLNEMNSDYAYNYQGHASSCIICLFTSMECFINSIIPEDFLYRVTSDKKTEEYNKEQIQLTISFTDKLTKVLPAALGKNYFANSTPTNSHIYHLRDIRNDIVHPKSDNTGEKHAEIIKRLLNFKYDETFNAVFNFFNFYIHDYIEECPCKENW